MNVNSREGIYFLWIMPMIKQYSACPHI